MQDRESYQQVVVVPGDISEEAHCRWLVERAVSALGTLDTCVNNAAYQMTWRESRRSRMASGNTRSERMSIVCINSPLVRLRWIDRDLVALAAD